MLHVPTNIRQMQIPSPIPSPTAEQKDFIPKEDTAPIVIESVEQTLESHIDSPAMSLSIDSPNLHQNILTQSMDPSRVSSFKDSQA